MAYISCKGICGSECICALLGFSIAQALLQRYFSGYARLHQLEHFTVQAKWAQEGLPSDALSIDNGAIISAAARWPLMIDPQLQGMKWVVGKEMPHGLIILQQSQPKYIDKVCRHFLLMLNYWQRFFHCEVYYGNVKV